ncbi:MAG: hypothetical protein O9327_04875 [Polaromonas sp.]|nr:hypothetical protein [Polaromonas sp.]
MSAAAAVRQVFDQEATPLLGPRPAVYFRLQGMEPRPVLRPVTPAARDHLQRGPAGPSKSFVPVHSGSDAVLLARVGDVDLEMVLSEWDRHLAADFVRARYARKGYAISATPSLDALATFQARLGDAVLGSVSVRLDTRTRGLAADNCFGQEIAGLRAKHRLCEFTRLAVDMHGEVSKPVIIKLFHLAHLYASRIHAISKTVMEVNPRHVAFYRRGMGAEQLAGERDHAVGAPAVLLALGTDFIEAQLKHYRDDVRTAPAPLLDVKPIYALGFTMFEETELVAAIHRAMFSASN